MELDMCVCVRTCACAAHDEVNSCYSITFESVYNLSVSFLKKYILLS